MRAVALVVVAACAARVPPVPGQGGPAWHEVRSAHFRVWSDAPEDRVRELVQHMEHLRSIIYEVAFPDLPPGGVTFVVAFRDERESRVFTPPFHGAYATVEEVLAQPMFVLPLDGKIDDPTITHELTHAISFNAIHHQPEWLAEGLATYFETIVLDPKHHDVDVGAPPTYTIHELSVRPLLPAKTLLACEACAEDSIFYSSAWTLVAYLRNTHAKQLALYEAALNDGIPPASAWQAIFPDLALEQLDLDMLHWLVNGTLAVAHYNIDLQPWPVVTQPLSDADVYALRALLGQNLKHDPAEITANIHAATAADPTNVLARAVEMAVTKNPPPHELAQQLVAAHRLDWLAWRLLYAAGGPDKESAWQNMCKIVVASNRALGWYQSCRQL